MSKMTFEEGMIDALKECVQTPVDIDQRIRWRCNRAGHCCLGTPVLLYPGDIWNLVHARPEVRSRFEIATTHDLFRDRPPHGAYFALYLGEHSGMPVSGIRHRPLSPQVKACPFLVPSVRKSYTKKPRFHLTVDGQPMMECGIHEGRPGICRAFPFGRLIAHDNPQSMNPSEGKTHYVDFREQCRSCYPDFDGEGAPEFTIREFLEQTGVLQIHKDSDRWLGILSKMQAIHSPAFRLLIGAMAYDFDTPAIKTMGLRPDARLSSGEVAAVVAARPPSFALLMDAIDTIVDAALQHAPPDVLRGDGAEPMEDRR